MDDSYYRYIRHEWDAFDADGAGGAIIRQSVRDLEIARVLDVGCGAAQELRWFVHDPRTFGVGLDLSPDAGPAARELFAAGEPRSHVAFVRAAAERLPFASSTFDVVICRLALPYTHNAEALAQMARVLRAGGALFLQFHHARYYTRKLRQAIATLRPKPAIHACRVLTAGILYHLTGSQPRGRFIGGETFQTMWLLQKELSRHGLEVRWVLEDSPATAPRLLIVRSAAAGGTSR